MGGGFTLQVCVVTGRSGLGRPAGICTISRPGLSRKPDVKCVLADFTGINKLFIGRQKVRNMASLPAMSEI